MDTGPSLEGATCPAGSSGVVPLRNGRAEWVAVVVG